MIGTAESSLNPSSQNQTNEDGKPASNDNIVYSLKNELKSLPKWAYNGTSLEERQLPEHENILSPPPLEGELALDLGIYSREHVSNCNGLGKEYFDMGLRLMLSYQHELASKYFLACLEYSPNCALAHGLIALCHAPNYNFKGSPYYDSANHTDEVDKHDLFCVFPSEQVAERHSKFAIEKIEELRSRNEQRTETVKQNFSTTGNESIEENGKQNLGTDMISDVEKQLLYAIRILTSQPGMDAELSEDLLGRPYADAMSKVFEKYPTDPDIAYFYAESLMVLNAWKLYEYPTGKPMSPDVITIHNVLEKSLESNPRHAGLCHLFVHLSEMSPDPAQAKRACDALREDFPHAGHLIHMSTHIDVLVGDYDKCVEYNGTASRADLFVMKCYPAMAGIKSFYFNYIVHNYHMGVYGAILGGMEQIGMNLADEVNTMLNEKTFTEHPNLVAYLETYSALEIHVMVRFGKWQALLEVPLPHDQRLMLYRTASIRYGRALANAMTGNIEEARKEAALFDILMKDPECEHRILYNNTVADLSQLDSVMMHGEILYRAGQHRAGLDLLQQAVTMQDNLNYDEPWGKMQPIRHAYGGLLLEQNFVDDAEAVFRTDLKYHPNNPWSLIGLISCLKRQLQQKQNLNKSCSCSRAPSVDEDSDKKPNLTARSDAKDYRFDNHIGINGTKITDIEIITALEHEITNLEEQFRIQRQSPYADFKIDVPCECCRQPF